MKAKSWKKFVKNDPKTKEADFSFEEDDEFDDELSAEQDPLQLVLEQNETLSALVKEREQLEQQMARLTGHQAESQSNGRPFHYGEIPSIKQKKEAEKRREERRKRELALVKKRKELSKLSIDKQPNKTNLTAPRSNLSPIDQKELISRKNTKNEDVERFDFDKNRKENDRFSFEKNKKENERFDFEAAQKKKEKERFTSDGVAAQRKKEKFSESDTSRRFDFKKKQDEIGSFIDRNKKKEVDEWLIKDEKKRRKTRKTLNDLREFGSELQRKKKELDRLNNLASDERFSDAFGDDFKDTLSSASKLTDKISKPFDEIKKNKAVQKFTEGWEKAKKKRLDASKVKSKYEKTSQKMLRVDVGSFLDMQIRLDKLKIKALSKKKEKEKEEEKELSRREQRKKEREEERKKEKEEERRREKKEEEKREKKREERRKRKKDND